MLRQGGLPPGRKEGLQRPPHAKPACRPAGRPQRRKGNQNRGAVLGGLEHEARG